MKKSTKKKPRNTPERHLINRCEKLQRLAFGAHQVQSYLDEVAKLPGHVLSANARVLIQWLTTQLIEHCDGAYDVMHVHVYGELSPRRLAEIENEKCAHARAAQDEVKT